MCTYWYGILVHTCINAQKCQLNLYTSSNATHDTGKWPNISDFPTKYIKNIEGAVLQLTAEYNCKLSASSSLRPNSMGAKCPFCYP